MMIQWMPSLGSLLSWRNSPCILMHGYRQHKLLCMKGKKLTTKKDLQLMNNICLMLYSLSV